MRHIRETQSMAEVRPLFEQQDVGAVEVFDDVGQAIGVLTQTDVDTAVREARLENQLVNACAIALPAIPPRSTSPMSRATASITNHCARC